MLDAELLEVIVVAKLFDNLLFAVVTAVPISGSGVKNVFASDDAVDDFMLLQE